MKTPSKCAPHYGFDNNMKNSSLHLSQRYQQAVNAAERRLSLVTSTPLSKNIHKNIMDISFKRCFEDSDKCSSDLCGIVIDHDSGYISNNQESSSVFTMESSSGCSSSDVKPIYLSEDALLEKPEVSVKNVSLQLAEVEEDNHIFCLSDSIIPSSFPSDKTSFSGLDDTESVISNESFLIPTQSPVIAAKVLNNSCDTGLGIDFSLDNFESSQESKCDSTNSRSQLSKCSVDTSGYYTQPQTIKTPAKIYKNPITSDASPDLFSDDETDYIEANTNKQVVKTIVEEKYIHKKDRRLINRVNAALSGVLPPPSFTVVHMTAGDILSKLDANRHLFWSSSDIIKKENDRDNIAECGSVLERRIIDQTSLLVTGDKNSCIDKSWPEILEKRYHGLQ